MKKKLLIEGMKCKHCVGNLQDALSEDISGVEVLEINLDGKYAIVNTKDDVKDQDIKNIIEELGFQLMAIE